MKWPNWPTPCDEAILKFARLSTRFFRFIHPDIVKAVVDDNEVHRSEWINCLRSRKIDPSAYLWEGSPCAFPGIRRHAGSKEIAAFRGQAEHGEEGIAQAMRLDDNDFPKQIWSFVFRGKKFSKSGPGGYALAHLADHKDYKNRFEMDFDVSESLSSRSLFGLYTSVANSVYVPTSLMKPTDFAGRFRNLLMRRAELLYGDCCSLLPPWLRIKSADNTDWTLEAFEWAEPVGTLENMDEYLAFRRETVESLMNAE